MAPSPDTALPLALTSGRPGRQWYALAALLLLTGPCVFAATLLHYRKALIQEVEALQRLIVPGGGTVSFVEPGLYTVYYESDGVFKGQPFHTPRPMPVMRPRAFDAEGEEIGGLQKVRQVQVYQTAGRAGHAMWHWQITEAGTYRLDAEHLSELSTPLPLMLGVGQLNTQAERYDLWGLYGAAGVLAFSWVAALLISLVTFFLRSGFHTRRESDDSA